MPDTFLVIILSLYLLLGIVGVVWGLLIYPRLTKDQQAAARQAIISEVAAQVVPGIEQKATDLTNEQKRQEAIKQIMTVLQDLGVKGISPTLISASLEASVYFMKRGVAAYEAWQRSANAVESTPPAAPMSPPAIQPPTSTAP